MGQGAMGEVYRGHDPVLNRPVAIKTIAADLGGDEQLRKRFQREAQSAARLNHPNIITVYDYGEEHNKIYMAMELLEGTDLKHVIATRQALTLDEKMAVLEQIADGLSFAHANDIVHRDLKPANIHVLPNRQVKIMDFGLARLGESEMTRTGMVMGTPHYMSPEQVRGERADSRSDIFSLGCVFYEFLAQKKPFEADSMHAIMFKVMQETPLPLDEMAPDLPAVLREIVDRCLQKDPAQRFQDAGELRHALVLARQALAEGRGDEPLPPIPASPRRPGLAVGEAAPAADARRPGVGTLRGSSIGPGRARPRSQPPVTTASMVPTPPPAARSSKAPLVIGGAVGLLVVLIGVYALTRTGAVAPSPPPPAPNAQVDQLTRTLAQQQAELARKRLDAGDHEEATRQAERALTLDPQNADAKGILERAKKAAADIEQAADAARKAALEGQGEAVVRALFTLMSLDPEHEAVKELLPRHEAPFRGRVEEARQLTAAARSEADKAGAAAIGDYRDAVTRARDAEVAARESRFGTATLRYLEARLRFDRARRAMR
ncbi:MAG TPA: serine/threonine-protein kinase [Vicinamibacteria bacterium]|nr:serine/threonine-protein kinase [Vicinamibacteria bacterium]